MAARSLWIGALTGLVAIVAIGAAACAGSASESPWPVEPVNTEPGPAGERPKQGLDVSELPNSYGAAAASAAPETEEEREERYRERENRAREHDDQRIKSRTRGKTNNDPMRGRSPMVP